MASASASAAAAVPSRAEVLSLFRSLLRVARHFSDYNVKDYTKRRTIDGFRHKRNLSDPSSLRSAFSDGKAQLEIARRQAILYSLFASSARSIMEMNLGFTN